MVLKKSHKILLGVVLLSIILIFAFYKFRSNTDLSSSKEINDKNLVVNNESAEDITQQKVQEKREIINENISKTDKIRNLFPESAYMTIVDLRNSPLSDIRKLELTENINNLYKYGSMSGGKITHEFQNLDKYRSFLKKHGYATIIGKINFKPADISIANKNGLELTGAYYSGGYTDGKGFDSLYRLYESNNGGKIEISQTKLANDGMKLIMIKETFNYELNNVPATFEQFNSYNTYSLRFVHDGYRYAISTQNLDKNELLDWAKVITES